jgi:hypothetical protein
VREYEVRILGGDGRPILISEWVHLNVNAAINSARRMANGAAFEVWTGGSCVYLHRATLAIPPKPPRQAQVAS